MGNNSKRRRYSGDEKISILKRHFVGKERISDICEQVGVSPTQFYKWQSELFEQGSSVFERTNSKPSASKRETQLVQQEMERLQRLLDRKDRVIARITMEPSTIFVWCWTATAAISSTGNCGRQ